MTSLSRREVLAGIAAATAVAVMPTAAATLVDVPPLPVVVDAAPVEWWGYSLDGEWWNGPFSSREEALAEAQGENPDQGCRTGRCIPHEMEAPDLRETCVLWLHHGCMEGALYADVCWRFEGANEDHDYDGEVSDELSRANWEPLMVALKDVFGATLQRHGRSDLIPAVIAGETLDAALVPDDLDPLLVGLENDVQFENDLAAVAEAWMVAQKLKDAPRRLDLMEEVRHEALGREDA